MPLLGNGLWIAEQNTKIPAITHWFSYRVIMSAANVTQTITVPTTVSNPAQATYQTIQPTGEPQQGRRFFCTHLVIRDQNGNLSGAGATAGGTVALTDTTQSLTVGTATSVASATVPPYIIQALTSGTCVINPNDAMSITYTQPTGATGTASAFTFDVLGYWQQGI